MNKSIKNYVYFCFNYPNNFILDCFGTGSIGQHLKSKFNGDVNSFFINLDSENQEKLLNWIEQNYKGVK